MAADSEEINVFFCPDAITMKQKLLVIAREKDDVESSTKNNDCIIYNSTAGSPLETSLDDPKLRNVVPKPYTKSKSTTLRPISLILKEEEDKVVYGINSSKFTDIENLTKSTSAIQKHSDAESTQTSSQASPEHSPSPARSILKSPQLMKKNISKHTPERGEYRVKIYDLKERSKPKLETKIVQADHPQGLEGAADINFIKIKETETENKNSIHLQGPKSADYIYSQNKFETFQNQYEQPNFKSATLPREKTVRFDTRVKQHQVPTATSERKNEENESATVLRTSVTQVPSPSRVEVTTIQTQPLTTNPVISCNVNIPLHVVNNEAQNAATNPFMNQSGYIPAPANNHNLYYTYPYFFPTIVPPSIVQRHSAPAQLHFNQANAPLPIASYYPQPFYRDRPIPHFTSIPNTVESTTASAYCPNEGSELLSRPSGLNLTCNNLSNNISIPETPECKVNIAEPFRLSSTIQNIQTNTLEENIVQSPNTKAEISEITCNDKFNESQRIDLIENVNAAENEKLETKPFSSSNYNPFYCEAVSDDLINCKVSDVNYDRVNRNMTNSKSDILNFERCKPEDSSLYRKTKTTNYQTFSSPTLLKHILDEKKSFNQNIPKSVFRFSNYRSSLEKNDNEKILEKKQGESSMSLLSPSGYKPPSYHPIKTVCGSLSDVTTCASLQEEINNSVECKNEKGKIRPVSCYSQFLSTEEIQFNRSTPSPPPINYTTYPATASWQEIFDKTPPLPGPQQNN